MQKNVSLRETCVKRLLKVEESIKAIDLAAVPDIVELDLYLKELDEIKAKFSTHHEAVIAKTPENDIEDQEAKAGEFYSKELRVKMDIHKLLKLKGQGTSNASTSSSSSTLDLSGVNLPRLDLPKFSGDYLEWPSFSDLFKSSVGNNTSLTASQKLQYLKSLLNGEPQQLISTLSINDDNYTAAWDILTERFDNQQTVVNYYIQTILKQSNLKTENSMQLRKLITNTNQCISSLKNMGLPLNKLSESILVCVLSDKLDSDSKRQRELSLNSNTCATFKQFTQFLENRCKALEKMNTNNVSQSQSNHYHNTNSKPNAIQSNAFTKTQSKNGDKKHSYHTTQQNTCILCKSSHPLYSCQQFIKLSIDDKYKSLKNLNACFNCLKNTHILSQCPSSSTCRLCQRRHHSLLHQTKTEDKSHIPQYQIASNLTQSKTEANSEISANHSLDHNQQVLLATAIVNIIDSSGKTHPCTVLLDMGSQSSFITEECFSMLYMNRKYSNAQVTGLGANNSTATRGIAQFSLSSIQSNFTQRVSAFILTKITSDLPTHSFNATHWNYIKNLKLADPRFNTKKRIDILLGADVVPLILLNQLRHGPEGAPIAQNTTLGWILCGPISFKSKSTAQISVHHSLIDDQLKQFWELEEIIQKPNLTLEEEECEKHFTNTHTRNPNGSYTVELPIKSNAKTLGNSKDSAFKRFKYLEKKFKSTPTLKQGYVQFMREYVNLNHMQLVTPDDQHLPQEKTCYIPHHAVFKDDSSTTKLRVVFDASAKSSTGISLNENLMVGPTIQDKLFYILIRFRTKLIAYSADIEKMYRQTGVHPQHTNLQRILWREDEIEPIKEYKLTTVTYGTSAAPFLAVRALQQLAKDEEDSFPLASSVILHDFYVDDMMSGADSVNAALEIQQQLIQIIKKGNMNIRKWSSNSQEILQAVPLEDREIQTSLSIDLQDSTKALGLQWHPAEDFFSFKVQLPPQSKVTKRTLLSDASRLFDPMGWVSPVIITAKILFQDLWKCKLQWDDELPTELNSKWLIYRQHLKELEALKIPRFMRQLNEDKNQIQLHGFSDASEKAYAAAIYIRTISYSGDVSVHLICSKTKVAPVKQISITRLELCGAVLLTKLFKFVQESFNFNAKNFAWTDSTIVLSWIAAHSSKWKTFVANRVSKIQEENLIWLHISSADNPADLASRGVSPSTLLNSKLWFSGPDCLKEINFYPNPPKISLNNLPEEKKIQSHHVTNTATNESWFPFSNYSSFTKIINIMVYIRRYIHNSRFKTKIYGFIQYEEYHQATLQLIKCCQKEAFTKEYNLLSKGKPLNPASSIIKLYPYLHNGLLRVGGRLAHSNLSYSQKHPILLPKNHPFTSLLIKFEHIRLLHAGTTLLSSSLLQNYWIVNYRQTIKQAIKDCIICFRNKPKQLQQQMSDLPFHRVTPSRPFYHCGVDLAGPFLIKTGIRGSKSTKCYICVFICMSVKAVHLELVGSLSTQSFIAALRRFSSRRGKSAHIYSDRGTNFIGAANELKILLSLSNTDLLSFSNAEGITWHFNPAASPHFGGIWEAAVKSVKYHLKRIAGQTPLTFEEFTTLLSQIEACLNSRPLTELSNEPESLDVLTPAHFLIGSSLTQLPDPDLSTLRLNTLSRWQLIQTMNQHFWKKWSNEYLTRLQQRPKWTKKTEELLPGELVIIKEDNLPPQTWKLGRITQTHPGPDGLIRVATLKTSSGSLTRPIVKLCRLPFQDLKDSDSFNVAGNVGANTYIQ